MTTISVTVEKTIEKKVEIELPMYGMWYGDVDDGKVSWETYFCINDKLELRCVTEYIGERNRWETSVETLKDWQVGQYLKYDKEKPEEFAAQMARAVKVISTP